MQKKPIHPADDKRDSLTEDQKERGYYYDDAHGYEKYDPDGEEDPVDSDAGDGGRGETRGGRPETDDGEQL